MERMIDLVGVQMDFGASKRGVNMGPTAIRYAGLCEGLEHMASRWKTWVILFLPPRVLQSLL